MTERLYADPAQYNGKVVRCIGCGVETKKSFWGPWCCPCNTARIDRINARLEPIARALGKG